MTHTDQMGRTVDVINKPKRIVSLVPSQTELLHYLGMNNEVVGITKFCTHPEESFRSKVRVGGTKNVNIDMIRSLAPDLIIANKEENVREQVEILAKEFPVWISDVNNLEDALHMITSLGNLLEQKEKAGQLANSIRNNFSSLHTISPLSVCYLIWRDPFMTVGGDTFIHDMLQHAGFVNSFGSERRYPEVDINLIKKSEWLLLSSEPYPFSEKDKMELEVQLPRTKIIVVDGSMFSWYGSRLLLAPAYFKQLKQQVLSLNHAAGN